MTAIPIPRAAVDAFLDAWATLGHRSNVARATAALTAAAEHLRPALQAEPEARAALREIVRAAGPRPADVFEPWDVSVYPDRITAAVLSSGLVAPAFELGEEEDLADVIGREGPWPSPDEGVQAYCERVARAVMQHQVAAGWTPPATEGATVGEAVVERVARAMAIHDDYDGCFERADEWNATPEDERHDDNYPGMDLEDCEWWRARARAGLAALPHLTPPGQAVSEADEILTKAREFAAATGATVDHVVTLLTRAMDHPALAGHAQTLIEPPRGITPPTPSPSSVAARALSGEHLGREAVVPDGGPVGVIDAIEHDADDLTVLVMLAVSPEPPLTMPTFRRVDVERDAVVVFLDEEVAR